MPGPALRHARVLTSPRESVPMKAIPLPLLILTLAACDRPTAPEPAGAAALSPAAGATAVVRFGINELGSPFPPQLRHDHSSTAADMLVPQTVVIARGGSVTFQIDEVHQAAVYRPG